MRPPLTGSFEEFESWIRTTIGGDFEWNNRLEDSVAARRMIASLVENLMARNDGVFPEDSYFIRRRKRGRRPPRAE